MLSKKQRKVRIISRGNIIAVTAIACVFGLIGFVALNSITPVNSNGPVFAPMTNVSLKAVKSSAGSYHYQHTKGGKTPPISEGLSPKIIVTEGNLVQIHLINEEKNQQGNPSMHNLNIDEFNVHTKDLSYFQTDSVTFLADKAGSFEYYCSIHPDMRGTIIINNS